MTIVHSFETPEGLRALLMRLHEAGDQAWRFDAEAHELARFIARKYSRLARKHHLDPWEAVTAAFEAMRKKSTRKSKNPWAVVTKAVKVTCVYEERAQGLLCSVSQARKAHISRNHDAERFADRDQALLQYHPALQTVVDPLEDEEPAGPTAAAVANAVTVFTLLGWPSVLARDTIDYQCRTLERLGSRPSAGEALYRDEHARAMLGLARKTWNTAITVLLGTQNPAYAATKRGRGLLMRLVLGEPLEQIFTDDDLVRKLASTAPRSSAPKSGLP